VVSLPRFFWGGLFMRYFLLLLAIMILSGCAHDTQQPVISQDNQTVQETDTEKQEQTDQFEYHPDTEVPEGSGIFTGKDGEFRVF
jgi:PBP1b-binding outer membrane lipoprotein LpoB